MKKTKVLVAMSGGVDSSVAALLMKKKGYEVIGVFMKNYSSNADGTKNEIGECNWKDERRHAMKIASILKIPLITLDFEKEYRKQVIEKMFENYKKGITPNPDIDCNEKVKFPLLIKAAKKLGAKFVVTGHYSRIKKVKIDDKNVRPISLHSRIKKVNAKTSNYSYGGSFINNSSSGEGARQVSNTKKKSHYQLLRAKDELKDQSYFLYRLKQDEMKHLIFPIGNYRKQEVREIAKERGFPNFDKKSTVGICFVGKVNLKQFLQKKIKSKEGKILSPDGKVIGKHDGIYYYTIGQRIGMRFGIDVNKDIDKNSQVKRWYVARKDAKKNIIVAAPEGHKLLYRKEILINNEHWIMPNFFQKKVLRSKNKLRVLARIRQVGELLPSTLLKSKKKFKVILEEAITGVSEGQAIVIYEGKKVLGGGEIRFL